MTLDFRHFLQIGTEQWLAQPDLLRKIFVRLFGPLGVHARIRNARIINAFNKLTFSPGAKILDAGCGHAYATFWLARHYPFYQFTALELDEKLVRDGRYISNRLVLKQVAFVHQSALDIIAASEYDLIFSIDLLEHIQDDMKVLCNFHDALRPRGFLLLHLPRRHQEHWRFFPVFKNHTTPEHVRDEYTASEIRSKLDLAGFEVIYLCYGFNRWGELAFESNYLFWKSKILRTLTALFFHPLSMWLAYMDTRRDYADGNSLLVLARPKRIMGAQ